MLDSLLMVSSTNIFLQLLTKTLLDAINSNLGLFLNSVNCFDVGIMSDLQATTMARAVTITKKEAPTTYATGASIVSKGVKNSRKILIF